MSSWLAEWTRLAERLQESYQRLYVAITVNTLDQDAKDRYNRFLDEIFPHSQAAEQKLKEKLLASNQEPDGFWIP